MENYYFKHLNKNLINTITLIHQILQNIKIIKKKLFKSYKNLIKIIIKIKNKNKNLHIIIRNHSVMTIVNNNRNFRLVELRKSLIK